MRISTVGLVTLVSITGSACIATEAPDPNEFVSGVLEGQVTRTDATPVGGPLLLISLLSAPQGGQVFILAQSQVLATDQGRFQVGFLVQAAPQSGTVAITVTPPIGSGLLGLDTTGIAIDLTRTFPPPDTTFVQLVLRPR